LPDDVEALLNLLQSHFDGVSLLNRNVRLREPKQRDNTTYITFVHHKSILRAISATAPLSLNGHLPQMRERIKTTLGLIGNYPNVHLIGNYNLFK
jgi:hypothetical protein